MAKILWKVLIACFLVNHCVSAAFAEVKNHENLPRWEISHSNFEVYDTYTIQNLQKDTFSVHCTGSDIRAIININTFETEAFDKISVVIGNKEFGFSLIEESMIDLDCPNCRTNFLNMWGTLRDSSKITVTLPGGQPAGFSFKDSAKDLPKNPCPDVLNESYTARPKDPEPPTLDETSPPYKTIKVRPITILP